MDIFLIPLMNKDNLMIKFRACHFKLLQAQMNFITFALFSFYLNKQIEIAYLQLILFLKYLITKQ